MEKQGLDYGKTFVIGFGFFTTTLCWALYNAYIPIFLRSFISSATLIGLVMTVDNWASIILQPWIGALSDRTSTRIGKRMPYIALGIPISALFFAIIPYVALREPGNVILPLIPLIGRVRVATGLIPVMLVIMFFNISMAIYRAPVVALMPDLTASLHRSKANGVINFMGGVGSILSFLVGSYLYDMGVPIPFVTAAVVLILSLIILLIFIREPVPEISYAEKQMKKEVKVGIINSIVEIFKKKEWSILFILLAIFFWFTAFNSMETWFTTYGVEILRIKESSAARIMTSISLVFILFALPAGFIGMRLGRKRTIMIGLFLFTLDMFIVIFVRSIPLLYGLFALAGVAWALINVNSITIVWELANSRRIGTYTGLYYFFSSLAQILAPPVSGFISDHTSIASLFPFAVVCFSLAIVMMLGVKKGEAAGS